MAHVPAGLIRVFGFRHQGDLGPLTTYTSDRGALVVFPRSSPLNPPSAQQLQMRQLFALTAATWRNLTQEQRNAWNELSRRTRLRVTGYNLFTWYQRTQDRETIATIARQAGIPSPT